MNIEERIKVLEELLTDICPVCYGSGDFSSYGPPHCYACDGKGRTLKKQIQFLFDCGVGRDNY